MPENTSNEGSPAKERYIFASMDPVMFGDWMIKASSCNHGGVLIIMNNAKHTKGFVRYFEDEYQANIFITMVLERSSTLEE